MKLIRIEDLSENFKIYLNDNFRKDLIKIAVKRTGGFVKLSKIIKFDWSSLCKLRRGYRILNNRQSPYFIKLPLLKKLLEITGVSLSEVEENVVGLATNKMLVKTKLPIYATPQLASIIGHALGDGHASEERFKYVNQRKELIEELKQNVQFVFGYTGREFLIKDKNCYGIEYPGAIGRLLGMLGIPLGRKVIQEIEIPNWIKDGPNEIKSAFIRALFDDEGSFVLGKHQKFISISMYKHKNLIDGHLRFLNDIRKILLELGIKPTKISFKKDWKDTKEFGFRIYDKSSLNNFVTNVGFTHKLKNDKLTNFVSKALIRMNLN